MTLEERLTDALRSADGYEPSPDLFARVRRSVEEDRTHRTRLLRNFTLTAAGLSTVTVAIGSSIRVSSFGRLLVPGWVLEGATTLIMVVLLVVLGPSIRRFGKNYTDDIFSITEDTGARILALLDVAYYLVFAGMILISNQLAGSTNDVFFQSGLEDSLFKIGRFMVLMGALHAMTLLVLPLIGFIYSDLVWTDHRRQLGRRPPPPLPGAAQSARVMRILLIVVAVIIALNLLGLIPLLIGGLLDS